MITDPKTIKTAADHLKSMAFLFISLGWLLTPFLALGYETGGPEESGYVISDEDRARIMEALPEAAAVSPKQPRKLLIYDVNVVYGGASFKILCKSRLPGDG